MKQGNMIQRELWILQRGYLVSSKTADDAAQSQQVPAKRRRFLAAADTVAMIGNQRTSHRSRSKLQSR